MLWGVDTLGLPIHDNWWQTETGGIMIANFAASEIRPGSMGRPLPGIDAAILRRDEHGDVLVDGNGDAMEAGPDEEGELALRPGWPSMFRGYLGEDERYRKLLHAAAGTAAATSRRATPTVGSGSSAAATTSSSRPAISSARSRWRAR